MVILITGCAHGLGLEMVNKFSKIEGATIIATSRESSIEEVKEAFSHLQNVETMTLDLVYPETFKNRIQKIIEKHGKIDILINNAAISYRSVLEHVEDDKEKLLFQTNYFGPRELIREVVPHMKNSHGGKIINISSVGGMMAMPTMSSYSASKFALEGMSEALYYELKPFNISVSLVEIGFVNSLSFKRVITTEKYKKLPSADIYEDYYSGMAEFVERIMKISPSTPDSISNKILNKIILSKRPNLRILATLDAYFFTLFRKIIPQRLYHSTLYLFLPSTIRRFKKIINDLF